MLVVLLRLYWYYGSEDRNNDSRYFINECICNWIHRIEYKDMSSNREEQSRRLCWRDASV